MRYLVFHRAVLVCFALLTAVASASAQDLVLKPLADRVAAKFTAIGRLTRAGFKDSQGCTATLIAPDLVLTAAHCVSANGRSGRTFAAGWSRGEYVAARGAILERRHPEYAASGKGTPINDIALVVLESPIEDVTPIPLGKAHASNLYGTKLALIGYHRKTPHILSGSFSCNVGRFASGLLHIGCPVIEGNSGSPVLRWTDEMGWEVVGVVSSRIGAGPSRWNCLNGSSWKLRHTWADKAERFFAINPQRYLAGLSALKSHPALVFRPPLRV